MRKDALDTIPHISNPLSKRRMALTAELVAKCFRVECDPGRETQWTALTDADFTKISEGILREAGDEPLWVFAYGSLIWKPGFDSTARQRATAYGWHRAFTLKINSWRGSPDQPGLMMALSRGGRCDGVIYRMQEEGKLEQIERVLRREVDSHEMLASMRWLKVKTSDGEKKVLCFWVGHTGRSVSPLLPLPEVAKILARACGHVGSGAEYLYNTVVHLEEFGIHDRNLWRLQELVAEEIRALHGLPAAEAA